MNDGESAISGSDTSVAAQSAPTSAIGNRESIEAGTGTGRRAILQKHKKFGDAYEGETGSGGHGSSGPARRVMDFFRRRGVVRSKGQ
jgi:protein-serine/threonine kinase